MQTKGAKAGPRGVAGDVVARYLANLAAMYRRDSALAARIDALPFADLPALEPARDTNPTLRVTADDGRPVYLHSRYRPIEEARKFVAAQLEDANPEHAAQDAEQRNRTFVVSGIGLGYHLVELERLCDRPLLIVAEDDLARIKAAFCVVDLSELIADGRLILLTAADKLAVHEKMRLCSTDLMLGFRFLTLPGAQRVAERFHTDVRGQVTDFVRYYKMQMVTLLRNARITAQNVAFNLPSYLAGPGIEVLRGRGRGYPAILVAAGPSLARNIAQLGALRERAIVIAVQTVFKLLLARGTPPHFVTSLDFHEVSRQFFEGVDEVGETILVAEPKATWHVLDLYPGRMHVLHAGFADDLLREAAPQRDALKPGSTVAHLSFYLAQHLECDPIILIGQDLAYSEGLYYPPGMPIEAIWQPELGRFQTVEMKHWERIVRSRPILRKVRDIHGRETYTDEQLFSYAEQFQADFQACGARVIHASEAGMQLEGVETMSLHDAAERFCTRKLPADLFASEAGPPTEAMPSAAAALERRLEELAEIRDIAERMDGLLEQLTGLLDRPAEFNRIVVRVDDLRTLIQKHERTYKLIVAVSQTAELRRYSADRSIRDEEHETAETARRRLRRDRDFVQSFVDGIGFLEQILPRALERLRERVS